MATPEREVTPEYLMHQIERAVATELDEAQGIVFPDWATVSINISPSAIPRETVSANEVIEAVWREWRSSYDISEIASYLPQGAADRVTPDSAFSVAIKNDLMLRFKGGWLTYPNLDRITSISEVGFATQTLAATVNGTSEEAEFVCKQLAILLWKTCGIDRKWSELSPMVEGISYRTSTVVELGRPLLDMLAPDIQDFISALSSDSGEAKQMGSFNKSGRKNIAEPMVIPYLMELDFRFSITDKVSGRNDDCMLDFLLHTRDDANRSRVKVSSELDFRHHRQVMLNLVHRLKART